MLMGNTLEQNRDLGADQVVAVRGQVTTRDDGRSIRVYEITQIEGAAEGENHPIEIQIKDTQATKENLERLEKILNNHVGYSKVILHMHSRSGGRSFELPKMVRYSTGLVSEIKGLFGLGALSQLAPVVSEELADDLAGQDVGALVVEQRLLFESE
jgi:DNA polymerase-3 subunit alpha